MISVTRFKHELTERQGWWNGQRLLIARYFVGSCEELYEVHQGLKCEYTSGEDFLAVSVQNEFGVEAPCGAQDAFEHADLYAKMLVLPATTDQIEDTITLFKPLEFQLPKKEEIVACTVLLDDWNDKWFLVETAQAYFALHWSTYA